MPAYTTEQYQELVKNLALGVMSITDSNGRSLSFRTQEQMEALKIKMEADLGLTPLRKNSTIATHRRGL